MAKDECKIGGDRMQIGPDRGDGLRPCVRHTPDHDFQTGWVEPLKHGKPINGADIVAVRYDKERGDFEVKPILESGRRHAAPTESPSSKGPAMVASDEYRAGWDQIFGKRTVGEA